MQDVEKARPDIAPPSAPQTKKSNHSNLTILINPPNLSQPATISPSVQHQLDSLIETLNSIDKS